MIKVVFQFLVLALIITSCNNTDSYINGENINVNDSTKIYTYKENGERVTGTVAFYTLDPISKNKYLSELREVKDGKRINKGYNYYPSGRVWLEFSYDNKGLISGTVIAYSETGIIVGSLEYKNELLNGLSKEFAINGKQTKEIIFKDGKLVKEYEFDEKGKKIIPAIEKLELTTYRTGFIEYRDNNHSQILYQPIILMKWKNISNEPLTEDIKIEGLFLSEGEEWSKETDYFQSFSDVDLQSGISRQSVLQSSVGYTSPYGIYNSEVTCQIFINDKLFKTIKISNKELSSNRL